MIKTINNKKMLGVFILLLGVCPLYWLILESRYVAQEICEFIEVYLLLYANSALSNVIAIAIFIFFITSCLIIFILFFIRLIKIGIELTTKGSLVDKIKIRQNEWLSYIVLIVLLTRLIALYYDK